MKTTTQIIASMLLLSILLFGESINDSHSIATTEYQLLNSVKLANQHKNYVDNMGNILKSNLKDKKKFESARVEFSKVLKELSLGDKALRLEGNELRRVRMKLSKVQRLWKTEKKLLDNAFLDKKSRLQAINTIDKIDFHMRSIATVYKKSYIRYTQRNTPSYTGTKQTLAMR